MTEDLSRGTGEGVEVAEEATGAGNETAQETVTAAEGQAVLAGQATGPVVISEPAPGATQTVEAQAGQRYVLDFNPSEARISLENGNLVLTFDNGAQPDGRIVFEGMTEAAAAVNPPIFVIGGEEFAANVIVGQAIALAEGETLETAAGAAGAPIGSGVNVYDDDLGDLIALLDPEGVIPPVVLANELNIVEILEDPILPDEAAPTTVIINEIGLSAPISRFASQSIEDRDSGYYGGGDYGEGGEGDPTNLPDNLPVVDANGTLGTAQDIPRTAFDIAPSDLVGDDSLPRVTVNGLINQVNDVDFYRVELKAGETITLDIDFGQDQGDFVDTQVFLLAPDGTVLADNDDADTTQGGEGSIDEYDSYLQYTVPADGFYFVGVTSYDNEIGDGGVPDNAGETAGDYQLQISIDGSGAGLGAGIPLAEPYNYIELYNNTDSDTVTNGVTLEILGPAGGVATVALPDGITIPANGFMVLYQKADSDNDTVELLVFDSEGDQVDALTIASPDWGFGPDTSHPLAVNIPGIDTFAANLDAADLGALTGAVWQLKGVAGNPITVDPTDFGLVDLPADPTGADDGAGFGNNQTFNGFIGQNIHIFSRVYDDNAPDGGSPNPIDSDSQNDWTSNNIPTDGALNNIGFFSGGGPFKVVYVIDDSGSTSASAGGGFGTILDAEKQGIIALNQSIIDAGLAGQVEVAVVRFSSSATLSTFPSADGVNGGGQTVADFVNSLTSGGGTSFTAAMNEVRDWFLDGDRYQEGSNFVFFLSDGGASYNPAGFPEFYDPGNANFIDANIQAFGVGTGASLSALDLVDDGLSNGTAIPVLDPTTLAAALTGGGSGGGGVDRNPWDKLYDDMDPDQPNESVVPPEAQDYAGQNVLVGELQETVVGDDSIASTIYGGDTLEGWAAPDFLFGTDYGDELYGGSQSLVQQQQQFPADYVDAFCPKDLADVFATDPEATPSVPRSGDGTYNLTSMGRQTIDGDTYTIWRLRNETDSGEQAQLEAAGGGVIWSGFLPANTDLFIASTVAGGAATHILTVDSDNNGFDAGDPDFTKAAGPQAFSYEIEGKSFGTFAVGDDGSEGAPYNDHNDFLIGGLGEDKLYGGSGGDYLIGSEDNDVLDGGSGDDRLFGDESTGFGFGPALGGTLSPGEYGGSDIIGGDDVAYGDYAFLPAPSVAVQVIEPGLIGESASYVYAGGNDTIDGGEGFDVIGGENVSLAFGYGFDGLEGGFASAQSHNQDLGEDTTPDGLGRVGFGLANDSIQGNQGADLIAGESLAFGFGGALASVFNEVSEAVTGDGIVGRAGNDSILGGSFARELLGFEAIGGEAVAFGVYGGQPRIELLDTASVSLDGHEGQLRFGSVAQVWNQATYGGEAGNDTIVGDDFALDENGEFGDSELVAGEALAIGVFGTSFASALNEARAGEGPTDAPPEAGNDLIVTGYGFDVAAGEAAAITGLLSGEFGFADAQACNTATEDGARAGSDTIWAAGGENALAGEALAISSGGAARAEGHNSNQDHGVDGAGSAGSDLILAGGDYGDDDNISGGALAYGDYGSTAQQENIGEGSEYGEADAGNDTILADVSVVGGALVISDEETTGDYGQQILFVGNDGSVQVAVSEEEILAATGESTAAFSDNGIDIAEDGTIFFTDQESQGVYRKTVDGPVELVASESSIAAAIGEPNGDPEGLVLGPDGFLYVTEEVSDSVLRIDPATGAVTVFASKAALDAAVGGTFSANLEGGIIVSADGTSLYVASEDPVVADNNAIIEIDLATGTPSVLAQGAPFEDLDGFMVLAPNGDILVTDDTADAIFRVTPAGVVTEFLSEAELEAVFGGDVDLEGGIWFDADGNLYVTEEVTDAVARFPSVDPATGEVDPLGAVILSEAEAMAALGVGTDFNSGAVAISAQQALELGLVPAVDDPTGDGDDDIAGDAFAISQVWDAEAEAGNIARDGALVGSDAINAGGGFNAVAGDALAIVDEDGEQGSTAYAGTENLADGISLDSNDNTRAGSDEIYAGDGDDAIGGDSAAFHIGYGGLALAEVSNEAARAGGDYGAAGDDVIYAGDASGDDLGGNFVAGDAAAGADGDGTSASAYAENKANENGSAGNDWIFSGGPTDGAEGQVQSDLVGDAWARVRSGSGEAIVDVFNLANDTAAAGNDTILAEDGDNDASGGGMAKADSGSASASVQNVANGSAQADNDLIAMGDGEDRIAGDVAAFGGGSGTASVSNEVADSGSAGSDTIFGGEGSDSIAGNALALAVGGLAIVLNDGALAGADLIVGDDGVEDAGQSDMVAGDAFGFDVEVLNANDGGQDTIYGNGGDDSLSGDVIVEAGGSVDLSNSGDDGGDDLIYGEDGDDLITGDVMFLGAGSDTLSSLGDDTLYGGSGSDTLHGDVNRDEAEGGDDLLYGGIGNDLLYGGAGDDSLFGGEGDDVIYGGEGDDFLDGGAGADSVFGDGGNDTIVFDAADTIDGGSNDAVVDGGTNLGDVLLIDGSNASGALSNADDIETLDMRDAAGGDSVTLTVADVIDITDGGNDLFITGDSGDTATLVDNGVVGVGDDWVNSGADQVIDGITFSIYTNNSDATVSVGIDDNLTVALINV